MGQLQIRLKKKIIYMYVFFTLKKPLQCDKVKETDYGSWFLKPSINEIGSKFKFNLNLNLVLISFVNDYCRFP